MAWNIMRKINLTRKELAINGSQQIRSKSWSDNFTITEKEKEAAIKVLDSGYLSLFEGSHAPDPPFSFKGGPEVQKLEQKWSDYYKVKHSISMNSGTSGLYAAIGALKIGYGDEVIVSPYTMSACALAPMIYGAIPVFADVELQTGCLDPSSVEKLITERTKAILVVHQFGIPADMDSLLSLSKKYNIKIIEDCAQAHGAKYNDKYVGTIGDIGVFSLNVNKTIQTGEGGVCITNDEELAYRLELIRNHGEAVVDAAGYKDITNIAGFNYRLTEIQASIALEQLKQLDYLNEKRLELVNHLNEGIKNIDFLIPPTGRDNCFSTFYVYPLRFIKEETNINRNNFVDCVNAEGISFFKGYVKPLYYQSIYQEKKLFKKGYPFKAIENKDCRQEYSPGTCPKAEELYFNQMIINEHIRLPHTLIDVDDIIDAINKIIS